MGVVSGDCCGMARYQTVMSIGEPGTGPKLLTATLLQASSWWWPTPRSSSSTSATPGPRESADISTLYLHCIYTVSTLHLHNNRNDELYSVCQNSFIKICRTAKGCNKSDCTSEYIYTISTLYLHYIYTISTLYLHYI